VGQSPDCGMNFGLGAMVSRHADSQAIPERRRLWEVGVSVAPVTLIPVRQVEGQIKVARRLAPVRKNHPRFAAECCGSGGVPDTPGVCRP